MNTHGADDVTHWGGEGWKEEGTKHWPCGTPVEWGAPRFCLTHHHMLNPVDQVGTYPVQSTARDTKASLKSRQ